MVSRFLGGIFGGSRGKEGTPQNVQAAQSEEAFKRATGPSQDEIQDNGLLAIYAGLEPEFVKDQLAKKYSDNPVKSAELLGKFVVKANTGTDVDLNSMEPRLMNLFDNNAEIVHRVKVGITAARVAAEASARPAQSV